MGGGVGRWLSGLAPRRRALVFGLLTVALAAALGVVVAVASTRDPPTSARSAGDSPTGDLGARSRTPGPVLLVPGYGGGRGSLDELAARIRATGRRVSVITLPGDGTGDLNAQARVLQAAAARALAGGADSVDVVGYSAGGVVVRLWLTDDGGSAEARHVVTLGSPLHGATIAAVGAALAPDACPVACQQLVPGSSLLNRLDAQPLPAAVSWMSVWTTDDETVDPPDSARLAGAVNVVAQQICPGAVIDHGGLTTDPLPVGLVLGALGPDPMVTPTAADCGTLRHTGRGIR